MTTYLIRFSARSGNSAVHSEHCQHGEGRAKGYTSEVEAASPEDAARFWREAEDADGRELPRTRISSCAKES